MRNWGLAAVAAASIWGAGAADAASVIAESTTPTLLGQIVAGQTYTVSATGVADLAFGFNGGAGLPFTADGKPTYAFPAPYTDFVPDGLDYDPSTGPSALGIGGAGKLIGALLGSFTASPAGPADYFTIGQTYTFTATSSGSLYGIVNDCGNCYPGNAGGFEVTLAAVPEPQSWAMLIVGLGLTGAAMRRPARRRLNAG